MPPIGAATLEVRLLEEEVAQRDGRMAYRLHCLRCRERAPDSPEFDAGESHARNRDDGVVEMAVSHSCGIDGVRILVYAGQCPRCRLVYLAIQEVAR